MIRIREHIVFENKELIAVNKPAGLLSIPDREGKDITLKTLLQDAYGEIFTVHRLDKDTSGLIVYARNEETHKHLSTQFENRETEKIYLGMVLGKPASASGVINEPIAEHPSKKGVMTVYHKGKESITEYQMLESFRVFSWMQFRILTGRTHQIRVHMKHFGHPIACDPVYGDGKPVFISEIKKKYNLSRDAESERPILNRLALHSSNLKFKGRGGEEYDLNAPLPKDLDALLKQLRKWTK